MRCSASAIIAGAVMVAALMTAHADAGRAEGVSVLPDTLPKPLVSKLAGSLGAVDAFVLAGRPQHLGKDYPDVVGMVPLGLVASAPMILLARADFTSREGIEAIGELKSRGRQVRVAHAESGSPSERCVRALQTQLGASWTPVVTPLGMAAGRLARGDADIACIDAPTALEHVKAGTVTALAVSGEERLVALWDVPTAAEVGLPLFSEATWYGLYARPTAKGLNRLNAALQRFLDDDGSAQVLADAGLTPFPMTHRTAEAHATFLADRAD